MASGRIRGITIEIGGDTTKLVSALKNVDTQIKGTQTALKDVNKLLKMDPGNTELLRQKQKELTEAINQTKDRLSQLKDAQSQVAKGTPEWDALQREIIETEQNLQSLENEMKDFGSVGKQQLKAVSDKVKEFGEKLGEVGQKLSAVGSSLTQKVTGPIVAAFGSAVKVTADFDAQMSKVQAISGATGEQFSELRDKAREMGAETKFSATEAGEAFEYMGMAGWKSEQMIAGIPAILNLAAASGEELGTTSDIVTDALTAFGLAAEDAGRFADVLAATSVNANTNVSMLGESFKYAAAPAGALGYSIEDVSLALGLMANSGIKADMAGTSLRNMFQRMAKPTKESAMAMERLGLELYDDEGKMYSFREVMDNMRKGFTEINMPLEEYEATLDSLDEQLQAGNLTQKKYDAALEELNLQAFGAEGAEKARAAAMLGGARAMSGLLAIANTSEEEYQKLANAIDSSSDSFARLADGSVVPLNEALASGAEIMEVYEGQAAAMAAVMQDNLTGDITVLKSMIQELAISLGDLLMPTIRAVVGKIQEVVAFLNSLDESQKEQIVKIAAIVAAVGPVILILGQVITAISGIAGAISFLLSPIGLIIAAIAALVAAFVYFYNTNEEFRNRVNAIVEELKVAFASFIEFITPLVEQVIEFIRPIIESLQGYLSACIEFFAALGQAILAWITKTKTDLMAFYSEHKATIDSVLNFIQAVVKTKFEVMRSIIKTVLDVITNIVRAFTAILKGDWDGALNHLKSAAESVKQGLVSIFNSLKNNLGDIFKDLINKFKQWGADMINNLIQGIKDKFNAVKDTLTSLGELIASYIHFSEPDVGPLSNFHTYAPDMMRLFAQGIRDNAYLITDAMSSSFDLRPYLSTMNSGIDRLNRTASTSAETQAAQGPVVVNVTLQGDAQRLFRVLSEEAHKDWQITGQSRLMGY